MPRVLIFIFIVFSITCYGQKKSKKAKDKSTSFHPFTIEAYYGNTLYENNFYNQLNTTDILNRNLPLQQLGLGMSNYDWAFNPRQYISAEYGLSFFIPANILINDSIKSVMSGFCWNMGFGKALFRQSKVVRLNFYLGFNTGRTKLVGENDLRVKNPYFSPKATIQPKLIIKRFTLSLILNYSYDISNQTWKTMRANNSDFEIAKFNQTHYSAFIAIGYRPVR